MTANEFKEAGLTKLSAEEIAALNLWLTKFAVSVAQTAQGIQKAQVTRGGGCARAIETQIEGTFNGWEGDTIFKLTNGQIWQQASYAYTYHYAYRPDATIYPSGGGCRMKVEGVESTIVVRRIN